jgi:hypothetical protein
MPSFAFWYAVFLLGGGVGATAGLNSGNGLAPIAGLLSGMALSGWVAQQLCSKRLSALAYPQKGAIQPAWNAAQASLQGLDRVGFASARPGLQTPGTRTVAPDTFGPLWLPKGMYELAMQKRLGKQIS